MFRFVSLLCALALTGPVAADVLPPSRPQPEPKPRPQPPLPKEPAPTPDEDDSTGNRVASGLLLATAAVALGVWSVSRSRRDPKPATWNLKPGT